MQRLEKEVGGQIVTGRLVLGGLFGGRDGRGTLSQWHQYPQSALPILADRYAHVRNGAGNASHWSGDVASLLTAQALPFLPAAKAMLHPCSIRRQCSCNKRRPLYGQEFAAHSDVTVPTGRAISSEADGDWCPRLPFIWPRASARGFFA